MTKKYDEIYDMCIDKREVKDEHLLACLKQAFDLSMVRIDDLIRGLKENDENLEDIIYDARAGIAYALSSAIVVGMNAEAQLVKKMFKENQL